MTIQEQLDELLSVARLVGRASWKQHIADLAYQAAPRGQTAKPKRAFDYATKDGIRLAKLQERMRAALLKRLGAEEQP